MDVTSKEKLIKNSLNNNGNIKHYRINIVNGCDSLFNNYKEKLGTLLQDNMFSIRHYTNVTDIDTDLFDRLDDLNKDWFNLFVFNVNTCSMGCDNKNCTYFCNNSSKCLNPLKCFDITTSNPKEMTLKQLTTMNYSMKWTYENMDFENYTHVIVSNFHENYIKNVLRSVNNCVKTVDMLHYIKYHEYYENLLETIYYSIISRSNKMKQDWVNTLRYVRSALFF